MTYWEGKLSAQLIHSLRTVTVPSTGFSGVFPNYIALTPDNRTRTVYPAEFNMTANPAQVVVNVEVPINSHTRVEVWTR